MFYIVGTGVGTDGSGMFLERDLLEIRALRQQLEVSINRNDKLREQLQKTLINGQANGRPRGIFIY